MQCEICHQKEATVHFKHAHDGAVREMHLCDACAAKKGLDLQTPLSLTDFLFGLDGQPRAAEPQEAVCKNCGMRWGHFQKASLLGCPMCYETFGDEMIPVLEGYQKCGPHVGKVPSRQRRSSEIALLQKALQEAVANQNFEEAAKLRDRLRDLREESEPGVRGMQEAGRGH
jgi:protein arginine kinase activator